MVILDPKTITKEEILADYNATHGSNLTFAQLGIQLTMNELRKHRRKMHENAIVEEIIV